MKLMVLAVFALACGCSGHGGTKPPTDKELARMIRGVWCVTEDGGKSCFAHDRIVDEKSAESCGVLPSEHKPYYLRANYTVSGNEICYEVTESTNAIHMPVGDKFCVVVLAIDAKSQTYRFSEDAQLLFKMYKLPDSTPTCPSGA